MNQNTTKIANLLLRFFKQQRELYGDGLVFSREEFLSFKNALVNYSAKETGHSIHPITPEAEKETVSQSEDLRNFYQKIKNCQKCPLGKTRTNFVFGAGNPNADLMLIGEAPGAEEDKRGEPFVGEAGRLLNKIMKAIQFKREDIYIANILKCRPPGNRNPQPEEIKQCEPYLHRQIALVKPKVILALGIISGQTLLKTKGTLSSLRGCLHYYQGIPMIVTYHPAALLRNKQWKYPTWDDVRYLRRVFDACQTGQNPQSICFKE